MLAKLFQTPFAAIRFRTLRYRGELDRLVRWCLEVPSRAIDQKTWSNLLRGGMSEFERSPTFGKDARDPKSPSSPNSPCYCKKRAICALTSRRRAHLDPRR